MKLTKLTGLAALGLIAAATLLAQGPLQAGRALAAGRGPGFGGPRCPPGRSRRDSCVREREERSVLGCGDHYHQPDAGRRHEHHPHQYAHRFAR